MVRRGREMGGWVGEDQVLTVSGVLGGWVKLEK